jgi:hypothetical protein
MILTLNQFQNLPDPGVPGKKVSSIPKRPMTIKKRLSAEIQLLAWKPDQMDFPLLDPPVDRPPMNAFQLRCLFDSHSCHFTTT